MHLFLLYEHKNILIHSHEYEYEYGKHLQVHISIISTFLNNILAESETLHRQLIGNSPSSSTTNVVLSVALFIIAGILYTYMYIYAAGFFFVHIFSFIFCII